MTDPNVTASITESKREKPYSVKLRNYARCGHVGQEIDEYGSAQVAENLIWPEL